MRKLSSPFLCRVMWCFVFLVMVSLIESCGNKRGSSSHDDGNVLVVVGDTALNLRDVLVRIPGGLDAQDSTALFHSIVSNWVESRLLEQVALDNLDNAEVIERLVDDYRRKLIVTSYLNQMAQSEISNVSESRIRKYFAAHRNEMKAEEPLIKGVYIKIPDNSAKLDDLRQRLTDGTNQSLEYIEKYTLGDAVQYDNFSNRWIPFREIADQIPYRFYDTDAFVESKRDFETTYNGAVYMLHISDYILSDSDLPYEYARRLIIPVLEEETMEEKKQKLVKSLYDKAVEEGLLKAPGYDIYK